MRQTILIIDDSSLMRRLADLILREHYDVLTAADAFEGLRLATEVRPALVLTDLHLPGLDGCGIRNVLTADARTRDIPVVIVTTVSEADHLDPEVHCLTKPFTPASLLGMVAEHLERPSFVH